MKFVGKKLNQSGFDHVIVALVVVVAVVLGGTIYTVASHGGSGVNANAAAQTTTPAYTPPWSGAIAVGSVNSGYCMDENGPDVAGTAVVLNACNNKLDQKWEFMSAGYVTDGGVKYSAYTIQNYKAGSYECVADQGSNMTPGAANQLKLSNCNGILPAERFYWVGASTYQLKNVQSNLCIDSLGSTAANNLIVLNTCDTTNAVTSQQWFKAPNTALPR